ncbi:MAG: VIT1/CCC1 transporter family protein, partial [Patescibacteria group bacterium]
DEVAILVKRITADKKLWLEEMVAKELRIGAGDLEEPKSRALIMGAAYIAGGAVPVLPFLVLPVGAALRVSVVATIAALFAIGFVKAGATGRSRWKGGMEMVVVASLAAIIGYMIGGFIGGVFGLKV